MMQTGTTSDRFRLACTAPLVALLLAPAAFAASFEWDGGAGSTFLNDAANWNPDGLPNLLADYATVTVSGTKSLSLTSDFGAKRLFLNGTGGDSLDLDLDGHVLDTSAERLYIAGLSATIRNGTIAGKYVELGNTSVNTASLSLFNATLALPEANWSWSTHRATDGASLRFSASVATNLPLYTVNTAITAENGSKIGGYPPNATSEGTNFSIVARGGSTVTIRTGTGGAHYGSRILLEDSTFVCNTHYYAGKAGTSGYGNLIAATNSTLQIQTLTFNATNDVIRLHNSKLNCTFGININGIGNRAYWSGVSTGTSAGLGIGTLFDVAPGSIVTNTSINLSYATNATVRVGKGATLSITGLKTMPNSNGSVNVSHGNLVEVDEGGLIHLREANFAWEYGLNGLTNVIRLRGALRVDRFTQFGTTGTSDGCRLELVGDGACYNGGCKIGGATGHINIGNADNPGSVAILFKPGPTGFGGTAPLITKPHGNIVFTDARIEVDAREFVRASQPNARLRLPLATSAGSLTVDVDALQARTTSLPAGGKLEKDGKTLYWTFTKSSALRIFVR